MPRFAMCRMLAIAIALGGCKPLAGPPPGARMVFDRPAVREDPRSVRRSANFPDLARARAIASPPDAASTGQAIRGRVLALVDGSATPLAEAIVSTSDGRAGRTGPDGAFAIPGAWPADGGVVAAAEGHAASACAELTGDEPLTLHLAALSTVEETPPALAERPFTLSGRLDRPVAGVAVMAADARGSFSAPVLTDADGRFRLTVFARGRALEAGTLLAAGGGWVGALSGLDASAGAGGEPVVPLVAADHRVRAEIEGASGAEAQVTLRMEAAGGAGLALSPGAEPVFPVAALPGVAWTVHAEALAEGTERVVHRPAIALDLAAGETRVRERLLELPGAELAPALVLNEDLAWREVEGATGYTLSLAHVDGAGFLWQAFTPRPAIPLSFQLPFGPGTYALTLSAWDAPGMAARTLASADGRRRLRLPAETTGYRRASRRIQVTI